MTHVETDARARIRALRRDIEELTRDGRDDGSP